MHSTPQNCRNSIFNQTDYNPNCTWRVISDSTLNGTPSFGSTVRTSIFHDIHLPIWLCRRSCHTLMYFLLPQLFYRLYSDPFCACRHASDLAWVCVLSCIVSLASSSLVSYLIDSFSRLSCLMISPLSIIIIILRVGCCHNTEVFWSKMCFRLIRKKCLVERGLWQEELNTQKKVKVRLCTLRWLVV